RWTWDAEWIVDRGWRRRALRVAHNPIPATQKLPRRGATGSSAKPDDPFDPCRSSVESVVPFVGGPSRAAFLAGPAPGLFSLQPEPRRLPFPCRRPPTATSSPFPTSPA